MKGEMKKKHGTTMKALNGIVAYIENAMGEAWQDGLYSDRIRYRIVGHRTSSRAVIDLQVIRYRAPGQWWEELCINGPARSISITSNQHPELLRERAKDAVAMLIEDAKRLEVLHAMQNVGEPEYQEMPF